MVLRRLDRPLVLTVPAYASIERGEAGNVVQLADAKRGERIAVWTEAATVTAAASEGRAGRDQRRADRSAGCLTAVPQDSELNAPLARS